MKKNLIALAVAGVIAAPLSAQAVEVDFGGDANVEGYFIKSGQESPNDESMGGWSQRIRAKMHFKGDGGVSVNTRLALSDTTWSGDTHSGETGAYKDQGADSVALDYGYIQLPLAGWTLRAGRQEANWAFCLTTCDDRRDRILLMRKFGSVTVLGLYDKRNEGTDTFANDPFEVDRDMYGLAAVGFNSGWLWGALLATWQGDKDVLGGMTLLGGFVKGKMGKFGLKAGAHYLGGSDFETENTGLADGYLYSGSTFAGFVEGTLGLGAINLAGEYAYVQDGSLVTNGFDTYSMFINGSPDNNVSNTNAYKLGGLGEEGKTQHLLAFKVSGSGGSFDWYASLGTLLEERDYNYSYTAGDVDADSVKGAMTFVQVGGAYNVTKSTKIYADLGGLGNSGDLFDVDEGGTDYSRSGLRVGIDTSF